MDLEWNTAFSKSINGYINEIIEIGAVKLDEDFKIIDKFSEFIKTQVEKKLNSRVKTLTNITNEDVSSGKIFTVVADDFSEWIGDDEDTVILTWGIMDVRVLIDNFKFFNGKNIIPFLNNYVDLQLYCMEVMELPKSQQIGLNNAAVELKINLDNYALHRALDDSALSAECFKKTYNESLFKKHLNKCDISFYEKLLFKPYYITDLNSPFIDKSVLNCRCTICGRPVKRISNWNPVNNSLRAYYNCKKCNIKLRVTVQFKKNYDSVNIKKSVTQINDKTEQTKSEEQKID